MLKTKLQPAFPKPETNRPKEGFACTLKTFEEIVRFAEARGMADATFDEVTQAWKRAKLH